MSITSCGGGCHEAGTRELTATPLYSHINNGRGEDGPLCSVSERNEFLPWVAGHCLRDRVRRSNPGGAQVNAAAPPHREEPSEVAAASVIDASGCIPRHVFRVMCTHIE